VLYLFSGEKNGSLAGRMLNIAVKNAEEIKTDNENKCLTSNHLIEYTHMTTPLIFFIRKLV